MAPRLARLGAFCARRKLTILGVWIALIGGLFALAVVGGGTTTTSTTIPGSPAQRSLDRMDRFYPEPSGESAQIVYTAPSGQRITERALSRHIDAGLRAVARTPGVAEATTPADAGQISPDGRTGVADVRFTAAEDEVTPATLDAVRAAVDGNRPAGTQVLFGGSAFGASAAPVGPIEGVGLLVALLVLTVTLGALLAAGLPLISALVSLLATGGALFAAAAVVGIPDTGLTLSAMLGLAVGIDYALFIIARHRTQLAGGMDVDASIARSVATSGSAVVFAAATVIVALAGLTVANVPMLTGMGLSAAGAVALAAAAALGLLPALLALCGRRLTPKPGSRAARRAAASEDATARGGLGVRWMRVVTAHPLRVAVACVVVLGVLAVPATQLRLALTDDGSEQQGTGVRLAYDRVAQAFGPGANGPLVVLVSGDRAGAVRATADDLHRTLPQQAGVARVSDPEPAPGHAVSRILIQPTTGPREPATRTLVTRLKADASQSAARHGARAVVTGRTAVDVDIAKRLSAATIPFTIVVVGLSILLLMVAFRSVWIPVTAAAGFLLSVGAAFGVTVAVFQWGWLADLLAVSQEGPVASFMPTIVMAVLFGLAMDYEVFLMSSMREAHRRGEDPRGAIVAGARHASRVVGSAAIVMIVVFASFLTTKDPDIKPIALALTAGVAVDAFVVRMALMPALLALLGDRAWRLPRRLERLVPDVDLEGGSAPEPGREPDPARPREAATA